MAAAAILDFGFYHNISAADHVSLTKFGVPTQILTLPSKIYPKFEFFKIQDGGRRHDGGSHIGLSYFGHIFAAE